MTTCLGLVDSAGRVVGLADIPESSELPSSSGEEHVDCTRGGWFVVISWCWSNGVESKCGESSAHEEHARRSGGGGGGGGEVACWERRGEAGTCRGGRQGATAITAAATAAE